MSRLSKCVIVRNSEKDIKGALNVKTVYNIHIHLWYLYVPLCGDTS